MTRSANHHATVVVVDGVGIMIRGASGSGKTTLALAIMRWGANAGRTVALVADDQVLLSHAEGRLVANAPESIAGLVEVRGRRPQRIVRRISAVLDLVVDLVDPSEAPRLRDDCTTMVDGSNLALLTIAARNVEGAFAPLASWLGLPPFNRNGA